MIPRLKWILPMKMWMSSMDGVRLDEHNDEHNDDHMFETMGMDER